MKVPAGADSRILPVRLDGSLGGRSLSIGYSAFPVNILMW